MTTMLIAAPTDQIVFHDCGLAVPWNGVIFDQDRPYHRYGVASCPACKRVFGFPVGEVLIP